MGSNSIVNKSAITHSTSAAIGLNLFDRVGAPVVGLLLLFHVDVLCRGHHHLPGTLRKKMVC